jgi:pyruvate dehydrogenase phosphatase
VALVGGHLSGHRGSIPSTKLMKKVPILVDHNSKTSSPLPHSAVNNSNVMWSFRDESLGMHLIRNALGGESEVTIRQSLSIPPPISRRFRDDITVAVITFDDAATSQQEKIQAKL